MSYEIQPRMTPGRRAFLEAVARDQHAPWSRSAATNHCLKLGWVDQLWDVDGVIMTRSQVYERQKINAAFWDAFLAAQHFGFVLTDAGRAALATLQ